MERRKYVRFGQKNSQAGRTKVLVWYDVAEKRSDIWQKVRKFRVFRRKTMIWGQIVEKSICLILAQKVGISVKNFHFLTKIGVFWEKVENLYCQEMAKNSIFFKFFVFSCQKWSLFGQYFDQYLEFFL